MTDKELLELAAKAAGGLVYVADMGWIHEYADGNRGAWWCPLDNDSDAFRLAVKLELIIQISDFWAVATKYPRIAAEEVLKPDPSAATRRAIVRAAAEIGRTK